MFFSTSSPGRFSLALGAGRPAPKAYPKAREKRPGDEVVFFCCLQVDGPVTGDLIITGSL